MPDSGQEVDSDYISSSTTTAGEKPAPPAPPEIEMEKYGTGKPVRKVVRAKITHGSQS